MEATQSKAAHKDVYAIINDRIIEQLEKGTVPWHKPWSDGGLPTNLISKRPYRGINTILLASIGYARNLFLTYKQLTTLGGTVNKDEKAHLVVFWKYPEQHKEHDIEQDEKSKKAILRYYVVYNIEQCTGIPEEFIPQEPQREARPIVACETVLEHMPHKPVIQHKENKAYYDPMRDVVNMPKMKSFESGEKYYATLFHELVHSTGHTKRLNRNGITEMAEFGSEPYSHEELVAEIGSCYLQSHCGIASDFQQSTAYIQSWLKRLKDNRKLLFSASSQAQKATDLILNIQDETEEKQGLEESVL